MHRFGPATLAPLLLLGGCQTLPPEGPPPKTPEVARATAPERPVGPVAAMPNLPNRRPDKPAEPATPPPAAQQAPVGAAESDAAKRALIERARRMERAAAAATAPQPKPKPKPAKAPEQPRFVENRSNYDRSNPAFPILQPPNEALSAFPLDRHGRVNWVEALAKGYIEPRRGLQPDATMESLDTDILMTNTKAMPHVKFPHGRHTEWLACENCHPAPFVAEKGANTISMETIMRGEHCGLCHDRVAFSVMSCERCHSVPHEGSPTRWW